MTASHEDPDISDAWDKFGPIGPLVFWVILEIYGREFNRLNGNGELTLSWKYLQNKLRTKRKTTENILTFYQERSRIVSKTLSESVIIKIPKFLELSSNWVRRTHHTPTEQPTEAPTESPTAIEEEVRSKNKKKEKDIYVEQAQRLFDYWKSCMGKQKSIFTKARKAKIIARLKEGYAEEDCMKAIENVSKSDFHMGDNDRGKQYNDIDLIFRNGEKLEGYRDWDSTQKDNGSFKSAKMWLKMKEEQDGRKGQGQISRTDATNESQPSLTDKTDS